MEFPQALQQIVEFLKTKAALAIGARKVRLETTLEAIGRGEYASIGATLYYELARGNTTVAEREQIRMLMSFVVPGGA